MDLSLVNNTYYFDKYNEIPSLFFMKYFLFRIQRCEKSFFFFTRKVGLGNRCLIWIFMVIYVYHMNGENNLNYKQGELFMLKGITSELTSTILSERLSSITKKFGTAVESMRNFCLFSEDTVYKHHFISEYMPLLYRKHTSLMVSNCVFCNQLVKSGCHKQCFKCAIGNYPHCSPLLPGLLDCESIYPYNGAALKVPWYYMQPCGNFGRLPQENYFRNITIWFSSSTIFNFEVLESLENGLLSGEKPCHVCASIDYGIYKKCTGQEDFHAFSPCHKIVNELAEYYQNQIPKNIFNLEAS